ncbi:hypothetical protein [Alteromonas gilva]|uniref:Uncharacterized protein n=1 Tax=Alteromonas gilva TaxID=2987522 RepID=A0ABT5L3B5_9ALTE|nr:hypothetical protein [Alteromonas gilva]MDC8831373.1 hypothetical protein [Alteromonas gilva]
MKSEIVELNVTQTSKTLALLAAVISILISIIGIVSLAVGVETKVAFEFIVSITVTSSDGKFFLFLFLPVLNFAATYMLVAVFCIVYNLVAKHTGGITFYTKPQ